MPTRRGDTAKDIATKMIVDAFGEGFVTIQDKKIYVNLADGPGGEIIQLAISMTMPKTPIEGGGEVAAGGIASSPTGSAWTPTELSQSDRETIEKLKKKLNIGQE